MKPLITQFSLSSCYFIPLRSKYSPQHSVLKYPGTIFFPQDKRIIFQIYKTTGKIMGLGLYVVDGKMKILDCMGCPNLIYFQLLRECNPNLLLN